MKVFNIVAFFIFLSLTGCKTSKIDKSAAYQINFLDEYILDADKTFGGIKIGGLSGIDYDGKHFILISDKSKKPNLFKVDIKIEKQSIKDISFLDVHSLSCDYINWFDPESIRFLPHTKSYLVSTEGHIDSKENAQVIVVDKNGKCEKKYLLPHNFDVNYPNKPRHNGVFEGLTIDENKSGFWIINELPLEEDGKKPKLYNTQSLIRLTHYNFHSNKPDYQLAYNLERLVKIPFLPFGLNGATEILQIDKNHLIVLERSYSAGHGSKGNRVKLFLTNISKAENTLSHHSLRKYKGKILKKTLIFDSKFIKNKLKYRFIDNIEGLTFGPDLPNGNKSLVLMSDNNFNTFGTQINQFLLLELIETY